MKAEANAFESLFRFKTPDFEKIGEYGFSKADDSYTYTVKIMDGQMELTVLISGAGRVDTKVLDLTMDAEYTLYRMPDAAGAFAGSVREECEGILREISDACFYREVFKSRQAKAVIAYIREKYGDAPEYLWTKFPDNAVFRRQDNRKWYAALLTAAGNKLGMDSEEKVEILDLRMAPEQIAAVVDGEKYYPGYHMNKKHWITVCLNETLSDCGIFRHIDESYGIAEKR